MAVHNFTAADLSVNDWRPMDTFPLDGNIYEVKDAEDNLATAICLNGEFRCTDPALQLTHWRNKGVS